MSSKRKKVDDNNVEAYIKKNKLFYSLIESSYFMDEYQFKNDITSLYENPYPLLNEINTFIIRSMDILFKRILYDVVKTISVEKYEDKNILMKIEFLEGDNEDNDIYDEYGDVIDFEKIPEFNFYFTKLVNIISHITYDYIDLKIKKYKISFINNKVSKSHNLKFVENESSNEDMIVSDFLNLKT